MDQIRAIISDADGTLVNTVYLIRHGQYEATVEYLLKLDIDRKIIPKYDIYESYINKTVGGNTRETIEKTLRLMYRNTHESLLNKINFDELYKGLAPVQDHLALLYVHPFHGLTELFNWAGKTETSIGIFSSGDRRMIMRNFGVSLPVLGYEDLFRSDEIDVGERMNAFKARAEAVYGIPKLAVVTSDEVIKTKPDPEGILTLMKALNVNPDEILVLGDLPVDMIAAKAAGMHAIGISHGFGSPPDLKEAGAIQIVDDLSSLPKLIESHNNGKKRLF